MMQPCLFNDTRVTILEPVFGLLLLLLLLLLILLLLLLLLLFSDLSGGSVGQVVLDVNAERTDVESVHVIPHLEAVGRRMSRRQDGTLQRGSVPLRSARRLRVQIVTAEGKVRKKEVVRLF